MRAPAALRLMPMALMLLPAACEQAGAGAGDAPTSAEGPPVPPEHAMPSHAATDAAQANRLAAETSPYLLQHAHNPVNWYPWGPEAFEAARSQGKPIFLSIGYSTCYWCHVMERESFEDEAVAALLNEHFVAIKVDREERPDVDDVYMTATQLIHRSGGWPMSVWLEPEKLRPFYAGTYFPREPFMQLLQRIAELWSTKHDAVVADAGQVAELVRQALDRSGRPVELDSQHVQQAVTALLAAYDERHGGFGRGGNKFPMPAYLHLLLGAAWDRPGAREALLHTLDRMATGGLNDQIGGGFHRYSTDERWLVPHFEKMLYDNGQLASVYAEAYRRTEDPYYARTVRRTLDWALREMRGPHGAFFSAQDAEVNAREGGNYLWTAEQVRAVLTDAGLADQVDFALSVYGLEGGTNFQDPHHPEDGPKNVVHLVDRPDRLAERHGLSREAVHQRLDRIDAALLAVRDRRDQPGTDDKVLTAWNGLMIAGLADGGRVLAEDRYVEAARGAADFILTTMRRDDGGLLRTYRAGEAKIDAFLEDYALLAAGLLALHEATGDGAMLTGAAELVDRARALFWDDAAGGWFDTRAGQTDLFVRTKSTYDGAVPCGNAIMLHNLLRLHELTGDAAYLDDAAAALQGLSAVIARSPLNAALSTLALHRLARNHPDRLDWATTAPAGSGADVVQIEASTDAVTVAPDEPGRLQITLRIADGYHLNAHEPGHRSLIPLNLQVTDGAGLVLHVQYPDGEPFTGPIAGGTMRVHSGEVVLPVRIEQVGEVSGQPRLALTWQACTTEVCLTPATVALPIQIKTR